MIRRTLLLLSVMALMISLFSGCGGTASTIYAADGTQLVTVGKTVSYNSDARSAYFRLVIDEAAAILSELESCTTAKAKTMLYQNGYRIDTAFDQTVFDAMKAGMDAGNVTDISCALTNLNGDLIAAYSSSGALTASSPYSSFKPLSVYMQAVEKGLAGWSSLYVDAPVKPITDENGITTDWPQNSTGTYTYEDTTVAKAVSDSINTVAVRCLEDVGVLSSITFLKDMLGVPLEAEEAYAKQEGEEEVLGNVALGYLTEGVTPADMAGYYQIFANGGVYVKPQAVVGISDQNGNVLYTRDKQETQVISKATAHVMNRLLREVVAGGTGTAAACDGVQVAGKTGTGDNISSNWFVGITPQYSCAVWHGEHTENTAAAYFSSVMTRVYDALPQQNTNFITHAALTQLPYCDESGMAATDGCTRIDIGYYADGHIPDVCDRHGNIQ